MMITLVSVMTALVHSSDQNRQRIIQQQQHEMDQMHLQIEAMEQPQVWPIPHYEPVTGYVQQIPPDHRASVPSYYPAVIQPDIPVMDHPVIMVTVSNHLCPMIYVYADSTVRALYDVVKTIHCPDIRCMEEPKGISIIFQDRILLSSDWKLIEIGFCGEMGVSNHIQVIPKPAFVSLLEMVSGITNKWQIPWYPMATHYLSDPRALQNDPLIWDCFNLSHFGLKGTVNLDAVPQSVIALDLSYNDLHTIKWSGDIGPRHLKSLNIQNNKRLRVDFTQMLWLNHFQCSSVQLRMPGVDHTILSKQQITQWALNQLQLHQQRTSLQSLTVDHFKFSRKPRAVSENGETNTRTSNEPTSQYPAVAQPEIGVMADPVFQSLVEMMKSVQINYQNTGGWLQFVAHCARSGNCKVTDLCRFYSSRFKCNGQGDLVRMVFDGCHLSGHVHLAAIPQTVKVLHLRQHNITNIGEWKDLRGKSLRYLDVFRNPNLILDLSQLEEGGDPLPLKSLIVSAVQIQKFFKIKSKMISRQDIIREWVMQSMLDSLVVISRFGSRGRHQISTIVYLKNGSIESPIMSTYRRIQMFLENA